MNIKLLTEHHLEFLSLKGGCTGSFESTLVKMPHCWKSHVVAQFINNVTLTLMKDLLFTLPDSMAHCILGNDLSVSPGCVYIEGVYWSDYCPLVC